MKKTNTYWGIKLKKCQSPWKHYHVQNNLKMGRPNKFGPSTPRQQSLNREKSRTVSKLRSKRRKKTNSIGNNRAWDCVKTHWVKVNNKRKAVNQSNRAPLPTPIHNKNKAMISKLDKLETLVLVRKKRENPFTFWFEENLAFSQNIRIVRRQRIFHHLQAKQQSWGASLSVVAHDLRCANQSHFCLPPFFSNWHNWASFGT